MRCYGPPVIVAINRRAEDCPEEHALLTEILKTEGVQAVSADPWNSGGKGCEKLAAEVADLASQPSSFAPLYSANTTVYEKLTTVVQRCYGGSGVVLSEAAKKNLDWIEKNGFGHLPVCIAKTQYSVSDDATKLNAPDDFKINVRELRVSAGAGFIVAVSGEIMLMPGLGKTPAAFNIDVDEDGRITGLF